MEKVVPPPPVHSEMRDPKRGWLFYGVVLASIAIAIGGTVHFLHKRLPQREAGAPLLVEARGVGRAWQFSFSGPDGVFGTGDDSFSMGELVVPAGVEVVLQLRSDDYIYVFSCPQLELKEIAVPDLEYSIAFHSDQSGNYELAMDPMCGFQLPPGEGMGKLRVAPESEFQHWLDRLPGAP